MDMIAPFAKTGLISDSLNLWLAIPAGVLLGLALQLAGFTDGRKIGRAFYFQDTDVPIVMFTAIVTAMVGLWGLGLVGFLDISQVYQVPTYLTPVIIGGLVFGVGMVVGGYCPGTAMASVVSGKIDALVYLLGFFIGSLFFGDYFPLFQEIYTSDFRGVFRLDTAFGIGLGPTILIMVLLSVGASLFMRWGQQLVWKNYQPISSTLLRNTQYGLVGLAIMLAAVMAFYPNSAFIPSEAEDDSFYIVPRPLAAAPGTLITPQERVQ